ncbi:MAG: CRISPR-associated protein Cas4 [bacterium]
MHPTGTLIWYYYICPREVWLMAHEITPEQENPWIEIGRLIHEDSYQREKKGFETQGMKIDLIKQGDRGLVVGEVKKSSRFLKSAQMQLAFYLYRLEELGINATGELLIPKEKKRLKVELNNQIINELKMAEDEIFKIISSETPPGPQKIKFCRKCGYQEFCWA